VKWKGKIGGPIVWYCSFVFPVLTPPSIKKVAILSLKAIEIINTIMKILDYPMSGRGWRLEKFSHLSLVFRALTALGTVRISKKR
tara:strand:- start:185 stop:439 length:255 start_codon:yes stop_codon:yes gene_type:complete